MSVRSYGGYGIGDRIARIAEQIGGAAVNGAATNYFGVRAAAEAVLKAGGTTAPTAQQLATAENQVLAVNEPGMTSTVLPLIAGGTWLATELTDHFTGGRFELGNRIGQGIGIPAARDFSEHVTALVRRKLRKVTAAAVPGFAGGVRSRGGARAALVSTPPAGRTSAVPSFPSDETEY